MRLAWSLGIAAAVLVAGGCSTQQPGDGSWTPPPSPSGPIDDSRGCVRAQRHQVFAAAFRLQRVVIRVLREEAHDTEEYAARVRRIVRQVGERLDRRCGERTALEPLETIVDARVGDARGALDEPTLRLVVDAFEGWATAVGRSGPGTIYLTRRPCVPYRRGIDVSIDVVREATSAGQAARLVLVVENRLTRSILLSHSGRLQVDGSTPDGDERRLWWGGSSADMASAAAGRTSRTLVWPGTLRSGDIPLGTTASVDITDIEVVAQWFGGCQMPVRLPEDAR